MSRLLALYNGQLFHAEPDKKNPKLLPVPKPDDIVPVREIRTVVKGKNEADFAKAKKSLDHNCFSVLCHHQRTLSFEVGSQYQRDLYVEAILWAQDRVLHPMRTIQSSSSSSSSSKPSTPLLSSSSSASPALASASSASSSSRVPAFSLDSSVSEEVKVQPSEQSKQEEKNDKVEPESTEAEVQVGAKEETPQDVKVQNQDQDQDQDQSQGQGQDEKEKEVEKEAEQDEKDKDQDKAKERPDVAYQHQELLTAGAQLIKHGKSGKPHAKIVALYNGMLFYGDVDKKNPKQLPIPKPESSLQAGAIRAVVKGKEEADFKRSAAKNVPEDVCFSVLGKERVLNLECASKAERDMWVDAVLWARDHYQAKSS